MKSVLASRLICTVALALLLAGCGADEPPRLSAAEAAPVGVVDSIVPIEEALRRFREGLADPGALGGGFRDRDSLVASFGHALFRADTAALAGMLVDRAEFAHLYYPTSQFAREPYELDPALLWFQVQNGTSKGITRALRQFGGRGYRYVGNQCEPEPTLQGDNRLWESCTLHYEDASGQRLSGRFFGSILERDGRFKFVSFTNPL